MINKTAVARLAAVLAAPLTLYAQPGNDRVAEKVTDKPNTRNYTVEMGAVNQATIVRLAGAAGYNVLFITSD